MSTSLLYHTQAVRDFKFLRFGYSQDAVRADIVRADNKFCCPACGSADVTATPCGTREVQGLPCGSKKMVLNVHMHRIRCHSCNNYRMESLPFVISPKARVTKALARTVLELRSEMSISAISSHFGLHWETVKNIEKVHLGKKYRKIKLKHVKIIGIDEVYMGKKIGDKGYLTIVRDLDSGAVLHVGKGKGGDALKAFGKRLKSSGCSIKAVAMDFSPAFKSWVSANISGAVMVFDHFHLIKLMNDKLDSIRRQTMNKLEEAEKKELKNQRYLFLRNQENLDADQNKRLEQCCQLFTDLGTAWFLKESLRLIYSEITDVYMAKLAFERWCCLAVASGIAQMKTMAKTIRQNLDGILAYWKTGLTNAAMEGFNNKVGRLVRQAYGYRDEKYLILKIYDLPNLKKRNAA